eukprot:8901153-Pyramimonas_sp.AAC.1
MAGSAEERRGRAPWRRAPQSAPPQRHPVEGRVDAPGRIIMHPRPKSMPASSLRQDADDGPGAAQT